MWMMARARRKRVLTRNLFSIFKLQVLSELQLDLDLSIFKLELDEDLARSVVCT